MNIEKAGLPLRTIARFQVTKSQTVLALIALAAILALGFSSIVSANENVRRAKILSNVESPAASIIFTQRETLVYATRLAQWTNGGTERRNVQIARNLLAQRLAVIDTSGRSMGSRAQKDYWSVLKKSDSIVASAPSGLLPENLHDAFNAQIEPIIDEILAEARRLVVSYQRSVDQEMVEATKESASQDRLNLFYFYTFLIAAGLFLFLNLRTGYQNFSNARIALDEEQKRLDATLEELKRVQMSLVELKNLDAAKNAFISTVNHELRTPLTSIIGYLDFIKEEEMAKSNPQLENYLEVLDRNAQILLNLVESMLSLSKIDAAAGKLPDTKVSLNEVIDNAIFIMKPASEKSNIAISFTAEDEIFVQGDGGQLSQVYINLLGNAIKFSPQNSSVEIRLSTITSDNGMDLSRVSVQDHGIGIPTDDIEKLFTRFFRAGNADSGQFPGTGLGLSIVEQVVTRHHGTVSLLSELGGGTTFIVDIPLYRSDEEKMIFFRRKDVLERAIARLEDATPETLKAVTHDIGGAIGFYSFATLGTEILQSSRALGEQPPAVEDFNLIKARLLHSMTTQLEQIASENNE